jgi:hypothetical protein
MAVNFLPNQTPENRSDTRITFVDLNNAIINQNALTCSTEDQKADLTWLSRAVQKLAL